MLFTMDGKRITEIPRSRMEYFQAVKDTLGDTRTQEVRMEFNRLIDDLTADAHSGARTFNSSYLGSSLSPWKYPLAHLSDAAAEMAGHNTPEDEVREKSGFSFGLFVWECIMERDEEWAFYEPNLPGDSNREITGKVYFERS
jgi:hypothetical protein